LLSSSEVKLWVILLLKNLDFSQKMPRQYIYYGVYLKELIADLGMDTSKTAAMPA